MAEDTQQAQTPVNDTQDSPMPSEQTEKTTNEAIQNELPQDTTDRTRNEFNKLRDELREERIRREALESAFKQQSQPEAQADPIYDPDTGYVNAEVLTATQKAAQEAAARAAKTEADFNAYRQQQEAQVAYQVHPDLNPDAKEFDKGLSNQARALILDSMLNPQDYGGKALNLKEAGDYLKKPNPEVEKAKLAAATEAIEQLSPKEQAALEATGNPARRIDTASDDADLVQRTRKGDLDAIVQRMAKLKS